MKRSVSFVIVAMLATALLAPRAQGSSHAVIIEGWQPTEASGLDWTPPNQDTLDELWNDCFLWFEQQYQRPATYHDTSRIHMLWADGADERSA